MRLIIPGLYFRVDKKSTISQDRSNRFSSNILNTLKRLKSIGFRLQLFLTRGEKKKSFPNVNVSNETKLSPSTLGSFYRHQKIPRETTMVKIEEMD
ncbi:uncharacterized protein OCT59_004529 [Rhizophagus irregularis]|uniref:uncharacterized protein n=1 Tax=Rhizophagus irregularis TaxID=588596 RepID=UPI00332A1DF2|nr:hypothetical protein OCT59_004529 [Rhizophagus irregularis]